MAYFSLFVVAFGVVLGTTEVLHRGLGVSGEDTRRFAHITGTLVAATLPFALSWGQIVLVGGTFTVLLAWSRQRGTLQGLHGVDRTTWGEVFYPAGLALLAALQPSRELFVYGTLVMGLSDGAAGFVGQHFGRHRIGIGPATKSVEGSMTFLVTTLLVGVAVLLIGAEDATLPVLAAAVAAVALTAVEMVLPWGLDNLLLPIAAAGVLGFITGQVG